MTVLQPSLHRQSGCPVHFLWDGRGKARAWVRGGFLGLMGAAVLASAGKTFGFLVFLDVARVMGVVFGLTYGVGQLLSLTATWRR